MIDAISVMLKESRINNREIEIHFGHPEEKPIFGMQKAAPIGYRMLVSQEKMQKSKIKPGMKRKIGDKDRFIIMTERQAQLPRSGVERA